jgi:hypothetical protein
MSKPRSRRLRAAIVASATLAGLLVGGRAGIASCSAPAISVRAGNGASHTGPVTVMGLGWLSGCDDTGGSCGYQGERSDPLTNIAVDILKRGGKRVAGGTVDANSRGAFFLTIEVALPPGHYKAVATGGGFHDSVAFVVTRA